MRKIIAYLSFFIVIFALTYGNEPKKIDLENCLKEGQRPWYHCLSRIDWRRANFPIRPPRLRLAKISDFHPHMHKPKMPVTPEPDPILPPEPEPKTANNLRLSSRREYMMQSPSESRQFLAWIKVPLRRERLSSLNSAMYRRVSSENTAVTVISTSVTTTPKPMPKLLLPTATRPAMYSLNGFVPKPSVAQIKKTADSAESNPKQRYHPHLKQMDFAASNRVTVRLDVANALHKRHRSYASKTKSHYRTPKVGVPGIDYPTYSSIPDTEFQCPAGSTPRMYADTETGCQVWHICAGSGGPKYSFICPNKSIFNEAKQTCDWWYRVECHRTKKLRRRFGRDT